MPPTDHAALIDEAQSERRRTCPCGDCDLIRRLADALEEAGKDAERLDWLDGQRKWGDCFAWQALDSGDVYVRPWRHENTRSQLDMIAEVVPYQTVRAAIDAARGSDGADE